MMLLVVLGIALATLSFVLLFGAEPGSATLSLALAGAALVLCLRSLHRLVIALSSPATEIVGQDWVQMDRRALREERRRLLRAINELAFDHAMGKLSDEDHRAVREGYELRAIEVIRALDSKPTLHPELAAELRRRRIPIPDSDSGTDSDSDSGTDSASDSDSGTDSDSDSDSGTDSDSDSDSGVRGCAGCGGANDSDARFCKHCGKELAA